MFIRPLAANDPVRLWNEIFLFPVPDLFFGNATNPCGLPNAVILVNCVLHVKNLLNEIFCRALPAASPIQKTPLPIMSLYLKTG